MILPNLERKTYRAARTRNRIRRPLARRQAFCIVCPCRRARCSTNLCRFAPRHNCDRYTRFFNRFVLCVANVVRHIVFEDYCEISIFNRILENLVVLAVEIRQKVLALAVRPLLVHFGHINSRFHIDIIPRNNAVFNRVGQISGASCDLIPSKFRNPERF